MRVGGAFRSGALYNRSRFSEALKRELGIAVLRARKHEELDASVTAELDDVILRLERCLESTSDEVLVEVELRARALESISKCLNTATNLAEIVRQFFGTQ